MATRIIKCIDCGTEIVSDRKTTVRCAACQSKHVRETRREMKKMARQRKKMERAALLNTPTHPCPYCGKPTHGDLYCDECLETGLDQLHATFGKTNGWDKKEAAKSRPPLISGNRGVIPIGNISSPKNDVYFTPIN